MTLNNKQILAVLALFIITIVWGATFILIKWALEDLGVYYFLFLRFLIATVFISIFFRKDLTKINKKTIKASFTLAIFIGLSFIAQTEGLKITTATNSAMITGLYLVFIPILSFLIFKEKAYISSVIGGIVSLSGLYLLTNYNFAGFNKGDFLTLLCAFLWAIHIIFTGRYSKRHLIVPLVIYQLIFVTLMLGIITLIKGDYTLEISNIAWLAIIITAIFATFIGILIQTISQKFIDPTRVGIIFALEAAFGALFAWWLGGESLTIIALIGASFMILGMIVSEAGPILRRVIPRLSFLSQPEAGPPQAEKRESS